jgi:hypothetical protein
VASKISLSGLSVRELEGLQTRVSAELTERATRKVNFTQFEFSPPDDRSYGNIHFTVKTKHGELDYRALVANGDLQDAVFTVNDVKRSDTPNVPDFFENTSNNEALRECARAVAEWVKSTAS